MGKLRSPWGKATTIAVVLFIFLIGWFLSNEAEASETSFSIAPLALVAGDRYHSETFTITEQFFDKYEIGLALQLRLECLDIDDCQRGESERANQAFTFQRIVKYEGWQIGFGASYWKNQSPAWNSHTPFMLSLGYHFSPDFYVGLTHFSTGGSSNHNGGLDLPVNFRWTF